MPRRTVRCSFVAKPAAALLLVGAADVLWRDLKVGSWLGGLALAWLAALLAVRPALRLRAALVAAAAAGFAVALAYDPGLLAWAMFWAALSLAALLPRARFDDAGRWAVRLILHGVTGPAGTWVDLMRFARLQPRGGRASARQVTSVLALPVAMTAVFVALFAGANPLIAEALSAMRLPSVGEVVFWVVALVVVWPSLRPTRWATRLAAVLPGGEAPGLMPASLLVSLLLFNAVFAVENGLDLAFLWSGAPLPHGVTLAEYAHRGAYPLIATALLAAAFVLIALQPGSPAAARPAIRRLVTLWVAQNVLLVASSALRTCDYVAAYGLTALRVAALAWMGLVALGLALIGWRLLAERSARWLVNAAALAATLVLAAFTVVDADAVAARWNVEHAREAGGTAPLDLCQLDRMGGPALLPLLDLEARPLPSLFRERVQAVREMILMGDGVEGRYGLVQAQADWRTWTWRGARRLASARERLHVHPSAPALLGVGETWNCDGSVARPATTPLTGARAR